MNRAATVLGISLAIVVVVMLVLALVLPDYRAGLLLSLIPVCWVFISLAVLLYALSALRTGVTSFRGIRRKDSPAEFWWEVGMGIVVGVGGLALIAWVYVNALLAGSGSQ